jgi:hypothetical protein
VDAGVKKIRHHSFPVVIAGIPETLLDNRLRFPAFRHPVAY